MLESCLAIALHLTAPHPMNAQEGSPTTAGEVERPNDVTDELVSLCIKGEATPEALRLLVERGADLVSRDERGWTPLMYAATVGSNPEVIAELIRLGSDVQATLKSGRTAFMLSLLSASDRRTASGSEASMPARARVRAT